MSKSHSVVKISVAWGLFFSILLLTATPNQGATIISSPSGVMPLSINEYLRKVLANNETLQVRLLEMEIARKRYQGERGIFEPEFVATYDYVESERQNTSEQERNQGVAIFEEKNNIYSGGLEALIPSGAQVRLGYTMSDLNNNLRGNIFGVGSSGFTNQYSSFLGLSLTQPLLKNAGRAATMANIRVAALASDIAFEEYRRQLMLLISTAEAAYWNLYMAQEQLIFFRESVDLAQTVLNDNQARLDTGRGSELEVLEASSGLALRKSRQSEGLQLYYEAANRMAMLTSESVIETNRIMIATEEPKPKDVAIDFFVDWQTAFELNPDYQAQMKKILQEKIRLAYAKNQRWPQLDLKASYGLNGLGSSPWESWDNVERGDFASWSIGFELRIPLTGGIRTRNEFQAAKLRQKQALLTLKELETQIANGLDTAIRKVRSSSDGVESYKATVQFTSNLLDSQVERLKVGRIESRKVLETEADLFTAKNELVQSLVNYRRALIELELIQGSILKSRNLELGKSDLESRTHILVKGREITDDQYGEFIRYIQWAYRSHREDYRGQPATSFWDDEPSSTTSVPAVNSAAPEAEPGLSNEDYQEALRMLRQQNQPSNPSSRP